MISFNDYINKYKLKNEATSNIKIQQILSFLSMKDVEIYLREGPFESCIGIVHLHPTKGTHWVVYTKEILLIHEVVNLLKDYLNEMDIVYILNTKYED